MEFLLTCLMAAGYLRDSCELVEAVRTAIFIAAPEKHLQSYLLQHLNTQVRAVPSKSTLQRHRLTVHLGFCAWVAELTEAMLNDSAGVVRWATMDASPQGGVDWIMSGATIMKVSDLVSAFRQANALCYEVDKAATAIIVEELASKLQIHQGVPAAVGSGRAGLKYKMHAVAHSMRLQTESLSSVVKLLNATWSIGDDGSDGAGGDDGACGQRGGMGGNAEHEGGVCELRIPGRAW